MLFPDFFYLYSTSYFILNDSVLLRILFSTVSLRVVMIGNRTASSRLKAERCRHGKSLLPSHLSQLNTQCLSWVPLLHHLILKLANKRSTAYAPLQSILPFICVVYCTRTIRCENESSLDINSIIRFMVLTVSMNKINFKYRQNGKNIYMWS